MQTAEGGKSGRKDEFVVVPVVLCSLGAVLWKFGGYVLDFLISSSHEIKAGYADNIRIIHSGTLEGVSLWSTWGIFYFVISFVLGSLFFIISRLLILAVELILIWVGSILLSNLALLGINILLAPVNVVRHLLRRKLIWVRLLVVGGGGSGGGYSDPRSGARIALQDAVKLRDGSVSKLPPPIS
jgi:hypothetical protein